MINWQRGPKRSEKLPWPSGIAYLVTFLLLVWLVFRL
jgi:hypothetical protein